MLKRQQVFTDSIRIKVDGISLPYHYDRGTDTITVAIEEPLANGVHFVETELVNYYGNHSLPSRQWFKVAPAAVELGLNAWTDTLPADGKSYVGISVTAFDADGTPIADGEPIYMQTSNGTLAETRQLSKRGLSTFYLYAPNTPGVAIVEAAYGEKRASLTINFTDTDTAIVQGQISDATSGEPLHDVQLQADPGLTATTDTKGHFFITTEPTSKTPLKRPYAFPRWATIPTNVQLTLPRIRQRLCIPNFALLLRACLHQCLSFLIRGAGHLPRRN